MILEKPTQEGPPKKVNLFRTLIQYKATIRFYEEKQVLEDGSLIKIETSYATNFNADETEINDSKFVRPLSDDETLSVLPNKE